MSRLSAMPNTPHTTFRFDPALVAVFKEVVAEQGETMTAVLERCMAGYVQSHGRDVPPSSPSSSSSHSPRPRTASA